MRDGVNGSLKWITQCIMGNLTQIDWNKVSHGLHVSNGLQGLSPIWNYRHVHLRSFWLQVQELRISDSVWDRIITGGSDVFTVCFFLIKESLCLWQISCCTSTFLINVFSEAKLISTDFREAICHTYITLRGNTIPRTWPLRILLHRGQHVHFIVQSSVQSSYSSQHHSSIQVMAQTHSMGK